MVFYIFIFLLNKEYIFFNLKKKKHNSQHLSSVPGRKAEHKEISWEEFGIGLGTYWPDPYSSLSFGMMDAMTPVLTTTHTGSLSSGVNV